MQFIKTGVGPRRRMEKTLSTYTYISHKRVEAKKRGWFGIEASGIG